MKIALIRNKNTGGFDSPEHLKIFQDAGVEVVVGMAAGVHEATQEEILKFSAGCDAILSTIGTYSADTIAKLDPSVKAIVKCTMGFDDIDVEAATKRGIFVCNNPDYAMLDVGVHQLALILACVRKITMFNTKFHEGDWKTMGYGYGYPSRRINESTVGLLGFGRIAKQLSKYLRALGATVYAYDPFLPEEVFAEYDVKQAKTKEELFAVADILSPNMPLDANSFHIINDEAIAAMKDGVIIVNTGRGPLIDTEALIRGLESGKVRAAGLDVFEEEPFHDTESKLMKFENVILTPHIAYQSVDSLEEMFQKAIMFTIQAAKGEMPYSTVNKNAAENRK